VGSVVAWALAKQTCGSLWNFIMPLDLYFMPSSQIGKARHGIGRHGKARHGKVRQGM
jgi:hypothetical protein